jgi:mannosyltransferase
MRLVANKTRVVVLFSIILVGILLRICRISSQSIWWDEGYTYLLVRDIEKEGVIKCVTDPTPMAQYSNSDKAQPLYAALTTLVPQSLGPEIRIRAISLIASILTIMAFWMFLGVQELGNEERYAGLVFVSLSPFLIFYSQEGRPYTLVMLWFMLFLWLANKNRRDLSAVSFVAIPALTLLIGITHFMLLFAVAAVFIYKLWELRHEKQLVRWIVMIFLSGIATLPGLYLAWIQKGFTSPGEISVYRYAYALYGFLVGFSFGPPTYELHLKSFPPILREYWEAIVSVACVGGLAVLMGAIKAIREKRNFVIIVPALVVILITGFAVATHIPLNPRHFLSVFPFFVVLIALGTGWSRSALTRLVFVASVCLLMLASLYNYYFRAEYQKEDNRGAAEFVTDHARKGDNVYVAVRPPFLVYYHGAAAVLSLSRGDQEFFDSLSTSSHGSKWVVLSRPWEFDPNGEKERLLRSKGVVHEFQYVEVFHVLSATK